jgi:hypothetical protein
MSYLNCPKCGLSLQFRISYLMVEHCPRCLARRGVAVGMVVSDSRAWPPVTPTTVKPGARAPADRPSVEDEPLY